MVSLAGLGIWFLAGGRLEGPASWHVFPFYAPLMLVLGFLIGKARIGLVTTALLVGFAVMPQLVLAIREMLVPEFDNGLSVLGPVVVIFWGMCMGTVALSMATIRNDSRHRPPSGRNEEGHT